MSFMREKLPGFRPKLNVFEVSSCPQSESLWLKSAAKLGCNLNIGKTESYRDFYYCIPTESKSKLVEFCYDEVSQGIGKGWCLELTNKGTVKRVNCTQFVEGCPDEGYLSETIFNYPACLQVNTDQRCYLAEDGCLLPLSVSTDKPAWQNFTSGDATTPLSATPFSSISSTETQYLEDVTNATESSFLLSSEIMASTALSDADSADTTAILTAAISCVIIFYILLQILVVAVLIWKTTVRERRKTKKQDEEIPLMNGKEIHVTIGGCRKAKNDLTIVCNISSTSDLPFSVAWEKDGSKIDIDRSTEKYRGGNQSEPSLTIHNFEDDCGRYQCFVTSIMGTFGSNILNLDIPDISLTGPSAVNLEERAIFIAACSSHLEITSHKWQRKSPNSMETTLDIDKEKYTGSSNDKLVINGAKVCDEAEYRLLVENIVGEGQSNGIQLTVKEDIFGKKELWKNSDKCDGMTRKDRLKLYKKLFWNKKEKTFSCTDEELCTHLDLKYKCENLESQDDDMDFESEDSKKTTLWDFLHEKGDISKNIKFWFAKSSDNSIIERYCVSPEYTRQEKETAICIPSEFLTEFVKKLDINILKHRTMNDESIYPSVSDILKVPTEILYSGDDAVQNYLKQLSKGNVKVYHARGMIVGCAGAGKTTLLKKLKELPLKDILDTKSTRGVDIQADVFTVSGKDISVTSKKIVTHFNIKKSTTTTTETVSDKPAFEFSPDDQHSNVIERGPINAQENPTNKRTDDINDQSFVQSKSDDWIENKMSSENTYTDSKVAVQTEKSPLKIVENTPGLQEKEELEPIQLLSLLSAIKDDNAQTITIFDFAGQLAYYVTHELYLSPRAFYVLVIDMTKDLDDVVKDEPVFIRWTYKELFQHWIKMIHAINRFAPVIPVVTHAEGKSKEDIKKFFVQIWNLIPEDLQKCHLDHKHEFAVELKNSFGITKIKESIFNIVSTRKHWGEVRPSSWVIFENYLMNAKMKIKVMKLEDLWTGNKKLDNDYQLQKKDDMKKMLQFFHDTGTVLYFDEDDLRDDIILDVPWFVDAFKHIITDPVHAIEDLARIRDTFVSKCFTCKKALDDLTQSGILSVSLVCAIWKLCENMKSDKKDAYGTYVQNKQEILRYMERLGMIAKITNNPEEMWYVPCMNNRLFLKEKFKEYSVSSTVCFKFKFLPPSIFYRLIASCINLLDFTILRWPDPEYFHKNAVIVHKPIFDYKYYFLIGNVELQNTIEIQVLIEKGFEVDRKNSSNFKNEITNQLQKLTTTFHTNLEKFKVGYRCRNTIFSDKTAAHFIPESTFEKKTIICPECKPPNRITCEEVLSPWNKTDERLVVKEGMSYVEYQTHMVSLAKKIAMTSQEMVGKAGVSPADLGMLANQLIRDYDQLASNSGSAAATSANPDIANRIRTTVQDLGKSCVELVQDAVIVQGNPSDTFARRDLQDHARSVNEKVGFVLATLQTGSRGTQACINAASTISGIIADLDTTIMFATAGTLNTEGDESFAIHREDILKTAKGLVEETKRLVQGAASDQETLAGAAQQAVKTITKLADVVKLGAASLGSNQPEAQVLIINAVKDVASALSDLISATKNAFGKNVSDPALLTLKESAIVMVRNVTSLLKTVRTVEDEVARGTRALESTIEAIGQEIKAYEAGTLPDKKASAEDLIRLTKPITTATAKAVAAGNTCRQDDVISCANMGLKAIFDLLATCRGAASTAETTDVRQKTIQSGKNCAKAYKDLLEQVNVVVQKPSVEAKQNLAAISHQIATSVTEIVQCAEAIKGTDWVDPEDLTVMAEFELLGAANSIEAVAKKLAQLKPRKKAKETDLSLNFEEQILEAVKSLASATAALVKSASAAQRELVAQGKIGATYHESQILDNDGQWSEGLISAARMVAAATHSLCESVNAMVQGNATEERLIASAKEVARSTAALLVACRVKADPDSMAMKRLQAAGNAVKRATEALVKSAQQTKAAEEEDEDQCKVGGIKQELQAQYEILRKEKELIDARQKLAKLRKQRYRDKPDDNDSSSSF